MHQYEVHENVGIAERNWKKLRKTLNFVYKDSEAKSSPKYIIFTYSFDV